jgi:hypothetical protein
VYVAACDTKRNQSHFLAHANVVGVRRHAADKARKADGGKGVAVVYEETQSKPRRSANANGTQTRDSEWRACFPVTHQSWGGRR